MRIHYKECAIQNAHGYTIRFSCRHNEGSVVFIDNGSSYCKVGFAGEEHPRRVFPSVIGCARNDEAVDVLEGKTRLIGSDALEKRRYLVLKYPIECGSVNNWDDMEQVYFDPFRPIDSKP